MYIVSEDVVVSVTPCLATSRADLACLTAFSFRVLSFLALTRSVVACLNASWAVDTPVRASFMACSLSVSAFLALSRLALASFTDWVSFLTWSVRASTSFSSGTTSVVDERASTFFWALATFSAVAVAVFSALDTTSVWLATFSAVADTDLSASATVFSAVANSLAFLSASALASATFSGVTDLASSTFLVVSAIVFSASAILVSVDVTTSFCLATSWLALSDSALAFSTSDWLGTLGTTSSLATTLVAGSLTATSVSLADTTVDTPKAVSAKVETTAPVRNFLMVPWPCVFDSSM